MIRNADKVYEPTDIQTEDGITIIFQSIDISLYECGNGYKNRRYGLIDYPPPKKKTKKKTKQSLLPVIPTF